MWQMATRLDTAGLDHEISQSLCSKAIIPNLLILKYDVKKPLLWLWLIFGIILTI
jgi:hypothetical protein